MSRDHELQVVAEGPSAKRRRVDSANPRHVNATRKPRLFAPFRTIGLVSPTSVPFTSVPLGKTTFQITTSVGRALQTYDLRRGLHLVFITRPQTPGPITASLAVRDRLLGAWSCGDLGRGVWIFKRGKKVGELEIPPDVDEDIVQLIAFGTWIVGCCETKIVVWNASKNEHHTTLEAPFGGGTVLTGGLCTIPTYPNKICSGREDGSVEIWNVSTGKLIYRILPPSSDAGSVCALQPAPAVSLIAIAYTNGQVIIHDIRIDRRVIKLNAATSESSPITSITFRTDGQGAGEDGRRPGVMATASFNSGDITLWDLNNGGRRMGTLRNAHGNPTLIDGQVRYGGVSKIEYLPGQAILVSTGLDNSLKTWISDAAPFSPIPRILHTRSGHSGPASLLQFLPPDSEGADISGKWLLSAGTDRSLWGWSLRRDAQSTELSQGAISKKAKKLGGLLNRAGSTETHSAEQSLKAPEIVSMAICMNRDGGMGALPGVKTLWATAKQLKGKSTATDQHFAGWESIVTAHRGEKSARTWYWGRKRAGRWILDSSDGADVTTVTISPCGTFAVLGSAGGAIDMYNLQSGLHRMHYPAKLTPQQAKQHALDRAAGKQSTGYARGTGKHTKPITGLFVDNTNHTLISCALDGKIKWWDFLSGDLLHEVSWAGRGLPTALRSHRPTELTAFACTDSAIRVVDNTTHKIVRELRGAQGTINDLCFSHDGRWIVAASSDRSLRVWDLPTAHMVEAVRFGSECAALAFSNTGEFLATAHRDSSGVNLWTNKALFTHVPRRELTEADIIDISAPTVSGENGMGLVDATREAEEQDQGESEDLPVLDQLSADVETLSLVPRARWQTLVNLEIIRERNKPKEVAKPRENAPFFLGGVAGAALLEDSTAATDRALTSRVKKTEGAALARQCSTLIRAGDQDALVEYFKGLPPAATDVEIRSLKPVVDDAGSMEIDSKDEMVAFVSALTARLRARRDYELVQAWMSVFLKCHGDVVGGNPELLEALREWRGEQRAEAERLGKMAGFCHGVVTFLRATR